MRLSLRAIYVILCSGLPLTHLIAANNGFYTGVQLGQSKLDASASKLKVKQLPYLVNGNSVLVQGPSKVKVDNDGFGGRAFLGYQFNQHVSLEGGYTQFADTKISNIFGITGRNETLHQGALDGVIKLMQPFATRYHVYAKGGAAYVFGEKISDASAQTVSQPGNTLVSAQYSKNAVEALRPTYGVGIDVDITRHISSDLSYTQILGNGDIQTSSLEMLGFSYHFS